MRKVRYTKRFRKDYKREKSGRYAAALNLRLETLVALLADDQPLPKRNFDHALTGNWKDYRDCHLWPDLLLIYTKPDDDHLDLVRLGSHSELSL